MSSPPQRLYTASPPRTFMPVTQLASFGGAQLAFSPQQVTNSPQATLTQGRMSPSQQQLFLRQQPTIISFGGTPTVQQQQQQQQFYQSPNYAQSITEQAASSNSPTRTGIFNSEFQFSPGNASVPSYGEYDRVLRRLEAIQDELQQWKKKCNLIKTIAEGPLGDQYIVREESAATAAPAFQQQQQQAYVEPAEIDKMNSLIKEIQKELKQNAERRATAATPNSQRQLTVSSIEAERRIMELNRTVKEQQVHINQLRTELGKRQIANEELSKKHSDQIKQLDEATLGFSAERRELAKLKNENQELKRIAERQQQNDAKATAFEGLVDTLKEHNKLLSEEVEGQKSLVAQARYTVDAINNDIDQLGSVVNATSYRTNLELKDKMSFIAQHVRESQASKEELNQIIYQLRFDCQRLQLESNERTFIRRDQAQREEIFARQLELKDRERDELLAKQRDELQQEFEQHLAIEIEEKVSEVNEYNQKLQAELEDVVQRLKDLEAEFLENLDELQILSEEKQRILREKEEEDARIDRVLQEAELNERRSQERLSEMEYRLQLKDQKIKELENKLLEYAAKIESNSVNQAKEAERIREIMERDLQDKREQIYNLQQKMQLTTQQQEQFRKQCQQAVEESNEQHAEISELQAEKNRQLEIIKQLKEKNQEAELWHQKYRQMKEELNQLKFHFEEYKASMERELQLKFQMQSGTLEQRLKSANERFDNQGAIPQSTKAVPKQTVQQSSFQQPRINTPTFSAPVQDKNQELDKKLVELLALKQKYESALGKIQSNLPNQQLK